jgi:hypothetical protein
MAAVQDGAQVLPDLKFQVDRELDKRICLEFLHHEQAGIDFGAGILKVHPGLRRLSDSSGIGQRKRLYTYIDRYYEEQRMGLVHSQLRMNRNWRSVSTRFSRAIRQLFQSHPWPKGNYVCYLSIFDCNPRFLGTATFQVFYKKDNPIDTIAHELMHFMFYHYVKSQFFKQYSRIPGEKLWELSEIFNAVALDLPQFRELTKEQHKVYYPKHKAFLKSFEDKLLKSKGIRDFCEKILLADPPITSVI